MNYDHWTTNTYLISLCKEVNIASTGTWKISTIKPNVHQYVVYFEQEALQDWAVG